MEALLRQLVLVLILAELVLLVAYRLRLPAVVGLIAAGIVIGPAGLAVLADRGQIEHLAELGILLLMFSIGLDFTPERFRELANAGAMGVAQMAICIVGTLPIAWLFVTRWPEALFWGMLISHTSSTLMLKLFLDRGELSSPHVQLGLGISITQDLSILPMLVLVPIMSGRDTELGNIALTLLKVLGVLAVALALARWVVPLWIDRVVRSRSRELFLIFVVIVSLGTAWATLAVGLSGSLGAFLAGLAVAASAYRHQTLAEIVPLRDLLLSLFFISIGMLVDLAAFQQYALSALLIALVVLVLKYFSGFLPVIAWGYPVRVAVLVGIGIAQIGEFGFVLAHAGHEAALLSDAWFQTFILTSVLTMLANPLLVVASPRLADAAERAAWLGRLEGWRVQRKPQELPKQEDHVILAGYGLNGRTVVSALRALEVPHIALDLNPELVRKARAAGQSVMFGDCTRSEVLRQARLESARTFVVAISDPQATRQAVQVARHVNPGIQIVARTKYLAEIDVLRELGADDVISEEFETSLEILARVLNTFKVSRLRIEEIVESFRGDAYESFRGPVPLPRADLLQKVLPTLNIESATVAESSPAAGKSLREVNLRAQTGATLLAVQREGRIQTIPPADFVLQPGDLVVLAGTTRQILEAIRLLEQPLEPPSEGD